MGAQFRWTSVWADIIRWGAVWLGTVIVFFLGYRMGHLLGHAHEVRTNIAFWKSNQRLVQMAIEQQWTKEEFDFATNDLYHTVYGGLED